MSKVLITGATGFIGSHLVTACLKKKHRVRALAMRGDPGDAGLKKKRVEIVYGDLRDGASLEGACKGIDIVFHCAAVVTNWAPRSLFQAVNIDGMEKLCLAALNARVKRFVELSTNDVFGLDESRVITEEAPLRKWGEPYADTKIAAEEIAWRIFRIGSRPLLITYTVKNLGSRLRFSIARAEQELGWKPRVTYREGLSRTLAWLKTLDLKGLKQK